MQIKISFNFLSVKNLTDSFALQTIRELSKFVLNISMNKENPWTLEPWHIRSAFRKAHVHVPEECFTMPEEPIKGPDMNLEGKEFVITITVSFLHPFCLNLTT